MGSTPYQNLLMARHASGGAIGLQTGDDTMGYRQMTIAISATKTPKPSTTSLPLAHSRIKSSGPF